MTKEKSFWQKLKKPILISAPMSGVTDAAFRQILAKYAKPDIIFTEFVSSDGLCSEGKEKLLKQLRYDELERPVVAQLFGAEPQKFQRAVKIVKELGFDGIDINMGCPDKDVVKQGAGAALIKNPRLASEIIKVAKKEAGSLPVSVKTRIGYSKVETTTWLNLLLKHNLAALIIHGRTKAEGYGGKADWEEIGKVRKLAQKNSPETILIGNGDIDTLQKAYAYAKKYHLDGIMIGRALLSNIFFFNSDLNNSLSVKNIRAVAGILVEHAYLFEKLYPRENFAAMRKFYKAHLFGFKGAAKLRLTLMAAKNAQQLEQIIKKEVAQ